MIKITRITTQKKNNSRYNIFVDSGQGEAYGFSVDEDILIEFNLHKGLEMSASMMDVLKEKDSIHKIYALAINYLSYRMRSKQEMQDYLIKKEYDQDQIKEVIERLVKENLLDDKEFAEALVRTRLSTSSKGPLLVKKELIDKGVHVSIADQAIQRYSYQDQYQKAYKWINKKLNSSSKKSYQQQVQSLQQTLIQKGFTQEVIQDVISEIRQAKNEDSEWSSLVYQGEKLLRKYSSKVEGYQLKHKVKAGLYRKGFTIDLIEQFLDDYIERQDA